MKVQPSKRNRGLLSAVLVAGALQGLSGEVLADPNAEPSSTASKSVWRHVGPPSKGFDVLDLRQQEQHTQCMPLGQHQDLTPAVKRQATS